tara:strand:- start:72 stop:293 length:222 start_codon:yes stop_codon:yes gene_type:complete
MNPETHEFHQRWYKHLCERRLELMRSEAYYARERRHVEKAIILYQVDGRWNGEYLEDEKDEFLKTHSLPIGPG